LTGQRSFPLAFLFRDAVMLRLCLLLHALVVRIRCQLCAGL